MKRLFTAFPDGWAGAALLLLRVAVGITAAIQGGVSFTHRDDPTVWELAFGFLMVTAGIALVVGLLTPVSGAVVILGNIVIAIPWFQVPAPEHFKSGPAVFYVTIMTVATSFLGPGAFSLDARMFGRREIVIPPSSHSEKL